MSLLSSLSQPASLRRFFAIESGAVTVDWTVLAGAIIGFSIGWVAMLSDGVSSLGDRVRDTLSGATVALHLDPADSAPDGGTGLTDTTVGVDLQAADQAQLRQIRGIGLFRSNLLIYARDSNGLNLNTASRSDLEAIIGIGPVLADRIIQFRNEGCGEGVCT